MSKLNKIFSSIPVKIPDRSGFDLSHEILTTAKTGTVVPVTHIEVLPGDTISMGSMMKVTLPPFAVPFMGRIDAELTAAFIPYRLLWQGWQGFITQNSGVQPTAGSLTQYPLFVPVVDPGAQTASSSANRQAAYDEFYGPGTLLDYLGYKRPASTATGSYTAADGSHYISALPFLAYHKFCDDWIRDDNNMLPYFPKVVAQPYAMPDGSASSLQIKSPRLLPTNTFGGYDSYAAGINPFEIPHVFKLHEVDTLPSESHGVNLFVDRTLKLGSLRQRCWSKDYFTTATTRPQAGAASSVIFDVYAPVDSSDNVAKGSTGFSIAELRAANSLQKWLERNNIAGTEYGSQILAHFGVTPPDAVLNRSVLLGSVRMPVVVSSVENNTGTGSVSSGVPVGTKSPYGNTLGAAAGFGGAFDKGSLIDNFTAKEHGIIMVFFSLIPHAYYNTGIADRSLLHKAVGDFPWPEFANIGDQPIKSIELLAGGNTVSTFGYNQRYSEAKFKMDRISGLLADGNSLSPYALQRGFASSPSLGKEFLEIPTDYLDQVLGVSTEVGGFGCMVDAFIDCKALRVLPEYSLPSL